MPHPIDGPWLKAGRAEAHLESLKEGVRDFVNGNPYGVVADFDRQTGKCVLRTKVNTPPPKEWSAIIGDFAHNLRSALDQLVWQLALRQTATPYDKTAFSIFHAFTTYRDNGGRRFIQNLTEPEKTLVRRLQPYHRGNKAKEHPLWLLQDINNTDKHRVIQTVGTVFDVQGISFGNVWGFDLYDMNIYGGQRLEEGAPVADFVLVQTRPDAYVNMNPKITPDVEFGEGSSAVEGMPLVPTLSSIFTHVERVIGMFDRRFL